MLINIVNSRRSSTNRPQIHIRDRNNTECYKTLITEDPANQSFSSCATHPFSSVGCETSRVHADGPEFWLVSSVVFFKPTSVPNSSSISSISTIYSLQLQLLQLKIRKPITENYKTPARTFPVMNFVNFKKKSKLYFCENFSESFLDERLVFWIEGKLGIFTGIP